MEQHIPLGMVFALNVLPSKQPPVPANVPTEGPCKVWSNDTKLDRTAALEQKVAILEQQLSVARASVKQCAGDI